MRSTSSFMKCSTHTPSVGNRTHASTPCSSMSARRASRSTYAGWTGSTALDSLNVARATSLRNISRSEPGLTTESRKGVGEEREGPVADEDRLARRRRRPRPGPPGRGTRGSMCRVKQSRRLVVVVVGVEEGGRHGSGILPQMRSLKQWGDGVGEQIRAAVPGCRRRTVGPQATSTAPSAARPPFADRSTCDPALRGSRCTRRRVDALPGTGIEPRIPRHPLQGRTVTCSPERQRDPRSPTRVLAVMLAFVKDFPAFWLDEPPERWNIASLGELAGQDARPRRARWDRRPPSRGARSRSTCACSRAAPQPEPHRRSGRRDRDAISPTCSRPPTTSVARGAGDRGDAAPARRRRVRRSMKPGVHLREHRRAARWSTRTRCAPRSTTAASRWRRSTPSTPNRCPPATGCTRIRRCGSPRTSRGARRAFRAPQSRSSWATSQRYVAGEPLRDVVDPDEGY